MSGQDDKSTGSSRFVEREMTVLGKFVSEFHQDYDDEFDDFWSGAVLYVTYMREDERATFRRELESFIERIKGKSKQEQRRAWFAEGAAYWPDKTPIDSTLRAFADALPDIWDKMSVSEKKIGIKDQPKTD